MIEWNGTKTVGVRHIFWGPGCAEAVTMEGRIYPPPKNAGYGMYRAEQRAL